MEDDEKQSIAENVTVAYDKTQLTLDVDQRLRIFVSIVNFPVVVDCWYWVNSYAPI